MFNSQDIEFLNRNVINLESIKLKVRQAKNLDSALKDDILENLNNIVGPQEAEWIQKNDEKNIIDYIIHRYKFRFYPKFKKVAPFPLHLLIEPVSFCNLCCVMCFQNDKFFRERNNRGIIDFIFFKNLVDQALENKCKALTLASRGEPTLHPQFKQMLEYCKGKFFELKINTNALILPESLCYQILDSGVDIVVFSIDSSNREEYKKIRKGGNFDLIEKNIRRFCEIKKSKKEYSKTSARISGVYMGYQDKEKFYDFWKQIVDTVTLAPAVKRWNTYENEPIDSCQSCNLLWERMYVWFDGTCNPCDVDYRSYLNMGNAKNASLKDIWMGEKYSYLRNQHLSEHRKLLSPCNRCELY
ncbi:MAG TPA: radical SAM/SPASM domain-containing protein [Candidatus Omnitrophota bacterium]|nr:radical SAM/SPASM domain-containing protein [Candidatus Omnitrophota bacterium]